MSQITPTTKVAELLERWPELEPILIAQAPAFKKLRNPVLRRTIARVATLEQAAGVAGLPVRDLVITLRRAAGQPVDETVAAPGEDRAPAGARRASGRLPCHAASFDSARSLDAKARVIDVDALLDAGQVPIKPVFDAAATLHPGQVLQVLASFQPVPLVEKLRDQGYQCDVGTLPDGRVQVSVRR